MEAFYEILSTFGDYVRDYVDCHRKLEEVLNEFRSEFRVLKRRKIDVNSRIQAEVHPWQEVKAEVGGWLEDVQKIEADLLDVEERARRVPYLKRASLCKVVREKVGKLRRIQQADIFNEGLVIEGAPARGLIIPTEDLVGEISTKDEICQYLMGNEVGMIGVCGIGGVGKTTIMKNLHNDLLRETRFQKVIWVTVSHPLNVFELQKKIASAMGKRLPDDEEVMMRAAALTEIMRRVKFVLILDDVWQTFTLKQVGIPDPKVQNGCKVVVTSRSMEVCSYLCCKIVKVQPLSQEESLKLFLDTVGHHVSQVPGLQEILKLIVEECAGLPLAIVVIAGSMRGVDDVNVWRNALIELRDCVKSVKDSNDEIFRRLRFSFDRLDSLEVKNCFLYCSFFREAYVFSRRELIEYWIDEGLIGGLASRAAAYSRGHAIIDRLEKNFLLEKATVSVDWHLGASFGEAGARMHDVVRDMAIISIGPEFGYMKKVGMNLVGLPDKRGWVRDLNLGGLKKLDLHRAGIEVVPQGMEMLISLEYLDLFFCPNLKEIPTGILPNLSGLQYLAVCCLRETTIVRSFEEVAVLKKLQTLECQFDDIKDFNYFVNKFKDFQSATAYNLVVGTVEAMRRWNKHELKIIDCEIGEECIVLSNNLEVLSITRGKNMRSSLNETVLLENANELRSCDIWNSKEIECVLELDSSSSSSLCCPGLDKLEMLDLWRLPRLCELVRVEGVVTPLHIFSNLKRLWVSSCSGMRKLLPIELLQAFQNLEQIDVSYCDQMEEIIASSDSDTSSSDEFIFTFPKLKGFHLKHLWELKSICSAKGVMVCDSIEEITMNGCPLLKRIPVQLLKRDNGQPSPPPHLREIRINEESKEWSESVEWDHPDAKNLLQPLLKFCSRRD